MNNKRYLLGVAVGKENGKLLLQYAKINGKPVSFIMKTARLKANGLFLSYPSVKRVYLIDEDSKEVYGSIERPNSI